MSALYLRHESCLLGGPASAAGAKRGMRDGAKEGVQRPEICGRLAGRPGDGGFVHIPSGGKAGQPRVKLYGAGTLPSPEHSLPH